MILEKNVEAIPLARSNPRATHAGSTTLAHPSPKSRNAMGRVLLLVGMAIVVFMASTAYSIHKQIRDSSELLAIKDTYFPVLQRLDANLVRVDAVPEIYVQVVGTGDRELFAKASEICAEADKVFAEINGLYPGRETDIARLRSDLRQYEDLAAKVSLALLDSPDTDISAMSAAMSSALSDLKTRLSAQRQSTYDGFVRTLDASQRDASISLYLGLALGLMNLAFMAVLVYFIRKNAKMMSVIAEQNATLELRVAERTAQLSQRTSDINAMLQNMKLGVAMVVPGNLIHQEYSNYLRTIFSRDDFGGKNLTETLLAKSDLGAELKDQTTAALEAILGKDAVMFDVNNHLLARELRLQQSDGIAKSVKMDWCPIVNDQGCVDKVLLISEDVTLQKQLELELAQARKLESIGQLSAGIAHEINTPTQFIGNNVGFLKDGINELLTLVGQIEECIARNPTEPIAGPELSGILLSVDLPYLKAEMPRAAEQALEGIDRIQKIVGAMKQFSHPAVERTLVDINKAIESTVIVASNEWKYVAELETQFDPELPQVPVMPGMFNQVILNMIVNAAHALQSIDPPRSKKGKIIIITRQVKGWAEIVIQDTGQGIPADIRDRIFDPFFTTKPVGKGTGQGLAIAHDVIVAKHGGSIAVTSELNIGTSFVLRLPIVLKSSPATLAA